MPSSHVSSLLYLTPNSLSPPALPFQEKHLLLKAGHTWSNVVADNCCGKLCFQQLDILSFTSNCYQQHTTAQLLIIHEVTLLPATVASNKIASCMTHLRSFDSRWCYQAVNMRCPREIHAGSSTLGWPCDNMTNDVGIEFYTCNTPT